MKIIFLQDLVHGILTFFSIIIFLSTFLFDLLDENGKEKTVNQISGLKLNLYMHGLR